MMREFPFELNLDLRALYVVFKEEIEHQWLREHLKNKEINLKDDEAFWSWFSKDSMAILTRDAYEAQ